MGVTPPRIVIAGGSARIAANPPIPKERPSPRCPGNDHIGIAIFDHAPRLTDAVQARGTGCHHGQIRPFKSQSAWTCPATILIMEAGTKKGVMRRAPD